MTDPSAARKAAERKAVALIRNIHTYCGINEPERNFCGKQGCGQYLTHEVHIRVGETEQEAGERIIAAACQTVAPPPENPGRTKLLMKFWSAMHLAGFPKDKEWDAQEKIHIKDLAQLLSGAAPAVSTPRCPKCKSHRIEVHYGLYVPDGKVSPDQAICRECLHGTGAAQTLADFAQFFQPTPEPPSQCTCGFLRGSAAIGSKPCPVHAAPSPQGESE